MKTLTLLICFCLVLVFEVSDSFAQSDPQVTNPSTTKTPSDYVAIGWQYYFYDPFLAHLSQMPNLPPSTLQGKAACADFYAKVKSKKEMKLIMGLGYYDFSEGEPFRFTYRPDGQTETKTYDFGMNATIDIAYEIMYRRLLTEPCRGQLELCGFTEETKGVYSKTVQDPEGDPIRAVIEIRDSSVSPSHSDNIGPLKDQQVLKSATTTEWFFNSIQNSDFVVYNGHSRKGGGPDFNPPKLLASLHVNYPWYAAHKPGLSKILKALRSPSKPAALLLMSCNSEKLFAQPLAKVAPEMGLGATNAIIPGNIPNQGAIAGMDAFLRFQCQEGFEAEMHSNDDLRAQIHVPVLK
jgi:hypothetical protein